MRRNRKAGRIFETPKQKSERNRAWRKTHSLAVRRGQLKRVYGLTPKDVDRMKAEQGGKCAICHDVPEKTLHIDHDHSTGKVRAMLCRPCNQAIGFLRDSPERADDVANYLRRHGR